MAFVVGRSKDSKVLSAFNLLSNGFIFKGNLRDNCFQRHSNWRAAGQSGNPATCAALVHVSPWATFAPVA